MRAGHLKMAVHAADPKMLCLLALTMLGAAFPALASRRLLQPCTPETSFACSPPPGPSHGSLRPTDFLSSSLNPLCIISQLAKP